MYLDKMKTDDGKYYVRIIESCRSNGKTVRRCLHNYGYVSAQRLHDIEEDFKIFTEAQKEAKAFREEIKEESQEFDETYPGAINLGCCFVKFILARYEMKEQFKNYQKKHHNLSYQVYQDFFYLVYTSVLDPCSIEKGVNTQLEYFDYFGIKLWDIYRSLDRIDFLKDKIQAKMIEVSLEYFADCNCVFYIDGTNVYTFSKGDLEVVDGEPGLRRFGKSKENRNLPVIGVTYTMTHNAFPLFETTFPGNRNDAIQLIPNAKILECFLEEIRYLYCGDGSYNSGTNNFFLAGRNLSNENNNGYLTSKAITGNELEKWILKPENWHEMDGKPIEPDKLESFEGARYKERQITRDDEVSINNNKKKFNVNVNLKQVVFFSPKLKRKKLQTIKRQEQKANSMDDNVSKAGTALKKQTSKYVSLDKKKSSVEVNREKIKTDKSMAGYYLLETSETDLDPLTIFRLYKDKNRIEWLIRLSKSEMKLRPVRTWKMPHIRAVIFIRFTGLVMVRALQQLLANKYSAEKIVESLRKFGCVKDGDHYTIFGRNEVVADLEDIFGLHFTKHMSKKELKKAFSYSAMIEFWGNNPCCWSAPIPGQNLDEEDWKNLEKQSNLSPKSA